MFVPIRAGLGELEQGDPFSKVELGDGDLVIQHERWSEKVTARGGRLEKVTARDVVVGGGG